MLAITVLAAGQYYVILSPDESRLPAANTCAAYIIYDVNLLSYFTTSCCKQDKVHQEKTITCLPKSFVGRDIWAVQYKLTDYSFYLFAYTYLSFWQQSTIFAFKMTYSIWDEWWHIQGKHAQEIARSRKTQTLPDGWCTDVASQLPDRQLHSHDCLLYSNISICPNTTNLVKMFQCLKL